MTWTCPRCETPNKDQDDVCCVCEEGIRPIKIDSSWKTTKFFKKNIFYGLLAAILITALTIFIKFPSSKNTSPTTEKSLVAISVSSEPKGAKIFINKEFLGLTPINVEYLKGKSIITLEKEGYGAYSREIMIFEGMSLNVDLKKKLSSSPSKNSQPDLDSRAKQFVREFLHRWDVDTPATVLKFYGDNVHLFNKDNVSKAEVLKDLQYYFTRWPKRKNKLVTEIQIFPVQKENLLEAKFTTNYYVERSGSPWCASGISHKILLLEVKENNFSIISITEEVKRDPPNNCTRF
jgi:hypothetical protein